MLTAMIAACGLWSVNGYLGKRLSSAWGVLLPAALMPWIALLDLKLSSLKWIVALALLATLGMLFHPRLRHFLLLPSCVVMASGLCALVAAFQVSWP